MKSGVLQDADKYAKAHRRKKRWYGVVTCLAVLVVTGTVWALTRPAVTLTDPKCGKTEHVHTEECYATKAVRLKKVPVCTPESLGVHEHAEKCYDRNGKLTCGHPDYVIHHHDKNCYGEDGNLWCTLPEMAAHTHSASCYYTPEPVTEPAHSHGDECYSLQRGDLICGLEESEGHAHTESCCDEEGNLVCGLEESEGHTHTDDCYAWENVLICDKSTEPIVIEQEPVLICGKENAVEHQHTDACFKTEESDEKGELICGLEEHQHDESCYADKNADVETADVWENTLSDLVLTGEWRIDVLAVAETQLGYKESKSNYILDEDGKTKKGYTRYGAWYGNAYGDWCAMFASFCIHYAGVEDMPLSAGCQNWIGELKAIDRYYPARVSEEEAYVPSAGDLVFFDGQNDGHSDHVGLVAEVIRDDEGMPVKIRTIEGNSSDMVQYCTYKIDSSYIMGWGVLPEQVFYCEKTGHVHSEACGDGTGEYECGLEEHIHTAECQIMSESTENQQEEETGVFSEGGELTCRGEDYTITVQFGAEAKLPEGVELTATEYLSDSEEYQTYLQQAAEAMAEKGQEETVLFARFFDVQFLLNGQSVEPEAPVSVTITYDDPVDIGEDVNCQAVHFTENGTEVLDVEAENTKDGSTSFTHTQDSFSTVGDVVTVSVTYNSTDNGPDILPVDYYVCIDDEWVCVGTTKTGWYGDYENTSDWIDSSRDCISIEQVVSVLGSFGFKDDSAEDLVRRFAYQCNAAGEGVYSDTNIYNKDGKRVLPLTKDVSHSGYSLFYLPANHNSISKCSNREELDKASNSFYTVKVFDSQGTELTSDFVFTGGVFTYEPQNVEGSWLVDRGDGTTDVVSDNSVTVNNITSPVRISPYNREYGAAGSRSVTFKVMIDGEWQTVGSLPYYYSGDINGNQRAYITSGMAAQFFGAYGYTADTDPGCHFGYSYNDIYTIRYSGNTGYCMDIAGGILKDSTAVQLYESNDTSAQIFRIWKAEEGYYFITPISNSNLYVNVYGGGNIDGTKLCLSAATDSGSQWQLVTNENGTTSFYTKSNPGISALDLPDGNVANGSHLQIWQNAANRYWILDHRFRISNEAVISQNSDGTYKIGLTPESNGDIVCYYLPGESSAVYQDVAESDIAKTNSVWSVRVSDDEHRVYSEGELSSLVQYIPDGNTATVTVKNAEGVIWSCVGMSGEPVDVTSYEEEGSTTFVIANINQPLEIVATDANPSFEVQYYANIPRFATSGNDSLKVIDTSAAANNRSTPQLPKNGQSIATKNIYLEDTGQKTLQNRGDQTNLYRVQTVIELTKLYTSQEYQFETSPGLEYVNKLKDNTDYGLKEIWVLKEGMDADSTEQKDWDVYDLNADTEFTNEAGQADEHTILITKDTVLRLVFEAKSSESQYDTTFYDYDITDGEKTQSGWITYRNGINSQANYENDSSDKALFAFGNQNCGTELKDQAFDGNTLNKANGKNADYQKSTFEIVTGLNSAGELVYNNKVSAPKLFNDGDASGKHTYINSYLTFSQVGDTYTLRSATLRNPNGGTSSIDELEYFFHPSPDTGKIWDGVNSGYSWQSNIFTNNFWPMDKVSTNERKDPNWGLFTDPGQFVSGTGSQKFPVGDDGNAHNWFFGMNFTLTFNLTADYEGPLEYYFFGDDDLWVFLDGKLICDIGGVHSSIGEYVDLRDYLPVGSSGQHNLAFFYTERGASGSTCYMSFTLPSVSCATTAKDTGSLQIEKKLAESADSAAYNNEQYSFRVELLTSENGTELNRKFSYIRSEQTGGRSYGALKSGDTISLKQNESMVISGIPTGTFYRVTELSTEGYITTVNGNEGYIASGNIVNGEVKPASFVNTPYYELPSTGGSGTAPFTLGGVLLLSFAGIFLLYNRKNERRTADFSEKT